MASRSVSVRWLSAMLDSMLLASCSPAPRVRCPVFMRGAASAVHRANAGRCGARRGGRVMAAFIVHKTLRLRLYNRAISHRSCGRKIYDTPLSHSRLFTVCLPHPPGISSYSTSTLWKLKSFKSTFPNIILLTF